MRHVLLVEDHLAIRKAYTVVLTVNSPQDMIVDAGSLAEARALVRTTTVDTAVVDLSLPDGSGFDLIPEIRAAHPHACVVVLTASTNRADLDQAQALGVRLLHKTDGLGQIRDVIEHLRAVRCSECPSAEFVGQHTDDDQLGFEVE